MSGTVIHKLMGISTEKKLRHIFGANMKHISHSNRIEITSNYTALCSDACKIHFNMRFDISNTLVTENANV